MTSTLTRPDTETVTPDEPAAADTAEPRPGSPTPSSEAPETLTFTVGDVTLTAKSEDEALRKYKRMVRSEGLKAKADMDWCVAGTNERLERLGVRLIGQGVPIRVVVTATRTMYLTVDADDEDEAQQMMAEGDEYIATLARENTSGGWKVTDVQPAPPREGEYKVGDADDTLSNHLVAVASPGSRACEHYSSRHGYCTRPAGHVAAGDRQHARGNGAEIIAAWKQRAPQPAAAEGDPIPVVNEEFADYATAGSGERCEDIGGGYTCTRHRGHTGLHAGAFSTRIVGHVWE